MTGRIEFSTGSAPSALIGFDRCAGVFGRESSGGRKQAVAISREIGPLNCRRKGTFVLISEPLVPREFRVSRNWIGFLEMRLPGSLATLDENDAVPGQGSGCRTGRRFLQSPVLSLSRPSGRLWLPRPHKKRASPADIGGRRFFIALAGGYRSFVSTTFVPSIARVAPSSASVPRRAVCSKSIVCPLPMLWPRSRIRFSSPCNSQEV